MKNVYDKLDLLIEVLGEENVKNEMIAWLGTNELEQLVDHISRMRDIEVE